MKQPYYMIAALLLTLSAAFPAAGEGNTAPEATTSEAKASEAAASEAATSEATTSEAAASEAAPSASETAQAETNLAAETEFPSFQPSEVTGDWYCSLLGVNWHLYLREDGTYQSDLSSSPDETSEGTWELKEDRIILDENEELESLTFDGNTLHVTESNVDIVFSRDPEGLFLPADPEVSASLADFAGIWHAEQISALGICMTPEELELDLSAVIDGTSVTLQSAGLNFQDETFECILEDGVLKPVVPEPEPLPAAQQATHTQDDPDSETAAGPETVSGAETTSATGTIAGAETTSETETASGTEIASAAESMPESEDTAESSAEDASSEPAFTLQLLKDGMLSCTLDSAGTELVFYLRAEEPALSVNETNPAAPAGETAAAGPVPDETSAAETSPGETSASAGRRRDVRAL